MAKRPSVLFINRVYPPVRGATGRILRDLARSFAADGWDVAGVTAGMASREGRGGRIRSSRMRAALEGRSVSGYLNGWIRLLIRGVKLPRHGLIVTMSDPPLLALGGDWI